ncbi:MAG: hypothetical protein ACTHKK_02790 [Candidatus Nitrosocosmicus sp.]
MNLTYKQATKSSKKANKINKYNEIDCVFEHILKCKSCLWEIAIYESKGNIPIDSKKIRCPVCKEKEMNSTKIKIIS